MWFFNKTSPSGFSSSSTAEDVTEGINGTGLTAIVTGASTGIGAETTRVLSLRGVHVVMAVRNLVAGANVRDAIIKEKPSTKVDIMELDLSSFASVKKFASEFNTKGLPLNILINNAGIFATPYMLSQDNIEIQFATNHLGHFLLTNLLLETMIRTSQQHNIEGRIVNVSSLAHRFPHIEGIKFRLFPHSEGIRFDKINDKQGYRPYAAYVQSKLANILHANELAKRLKEDGVAITANSLHPGTIANTEIWRHKSIFNGLVNLIGRYFMKNIQQGAATTCYVALNPQVKGISGKYFADNNIGNPSELSQDTKLAKKLWEFSINLVD